MALHLLKLIWNRKRANFLIVTEILLSFLVLAAVTTIAVHYWRNYQAPLGFSYERIWDVVVRVPRGIDRHADVERERLARLVRLVEAVRQMPEVESVSHIELPTFRNWQWNSDIKLPDGRRVDFNGNRGGDELAATHVDPDRRRTLVLARGCRPELGGRRHQCGDGPRRSSAPSRRPARPCRATTDAASPERRTAAADRSASSA